MRKLGLFALGFATGTLAACWAWAYMEHEEPLDRQALVSRARGIR